MDLYTGGKVGEFFAALAFSGALIAVISLFKADASEEGEARAWQKLGDTGFLAHALGIFGVIGTLFYLIYSHQYQYHYIWSHSSNELPVHFMISCFWEGQEGSFLLWSFWHSVLGLIILFQKNPWRNLVLGILASIELILSSMILGIYIGSEIVEAFYYGLCILSTLYLAYRFLKHRDSLALQGNFHLASLFIGIASLILIAKGLTGFVLPWSWASSFDNIGLFAFSVFMLGLLGYIYYFLLYAYKAKDSSHNPTGDLLAAFVLLGMAVTAAWFEPDVWKVGSSPFITLKDALPNEDIFRTNPDFVPTNGNGLNPLLQNYWMVIHPPTLFLGFASTAIPFAFVMAALIKGSYTDWIKTAMPWTTFSIMILGVGIIMGGYWAYETLNFGGYWNWDPVENSSLVPWICGVASLHALLIFQRKKTHLKLAMILIISTFLLVLYSTFLTRSGILGDTSVHTFVDLGLSGQLLALCFVYFGGVILALLYRWKDIPAKAEDGKVWTAHFMLFLGVLVLIFSGLEIIFSTSLPVINKILGTSLAPPPQIQLFYYQWNVWFALGIAILSGIGQFLWWRIEHKKSISNALYWPFLIALLTGSGILIFKVFRQMDFAFEAEFASILQAAEGQNLFVKAGTYLRYYLITLADELLLFSALFTVFANGYVLIQLLKKNRKRLKVMGGTLVHLGFGMMLLGILFSSGYDKVISTNLNPEELAGMPEEEMADNVLLFKDEPRQIDGYSVTYKGILKAEAPLSDLKVLEKFRDGFKVSFRDATGDRFAVALPWFKVFLKEDSVVNVGERVPSINTEVDHNTVAPSSENEINLDSLKVFLTNNLQLIDPPRINNRVLYGVQFASLNDTSQKFTLYPEAESSGDGQGIMAHPSRKIFADRDIYVFVSAAPTQEQLKPKYRQYDFQMRIGDTVQIGENRLLYLEGIQQMGGRPELAQYQIAAAANLIVMASGQGFQTRPIYTIDSNNRPGMVPSRVEELFMDFAFVDINPQEQFVRIQVQELTNPYDDNIVIKAIQKPMINLLWLGTFLLAFGFMVSIYRRTQDIRKTRS